MPNSYATVSLQSRSYLECKPIQKVGAQNTTSKVARQVHMVASGPLSAMTSCGFKRNNKYSEVKQLS